MISGIHAPNASISPSTLEIIQRGGFRAAKLMAYHTAAEVATLRTAGVTHFTVRTRDSVWRKHDGSQYIPSFHDYGDALVADLIKFYNMGIKDGQIDCEPNISWAAVHSEYDPWIYRAFMLDVLGYIAPKLPPDLRLGFPPLSFSPQYEPNHWLDVLADLAPRFQFLCVNSYWQSSRTGEDNILAGPMTWQQFGGNCEEYHRRFSSMTMQIVEWGNSIHERQLFTPAQVDAFRVEQYPIYLRWLPAHPYVEAAFCWIAPKATSDWTGFEITPAVASAMKTN